MTRAARTSADAPRRRVASPCISVCLLDANDVCSGCWRTSQEITWWFDMDDERRLEVLRASRERMRSAGVLFD